MQTALSNWSKDGQSIVCQPIEPVYRFDKNGPVPNERHQPKNDVTTDIENVLPETLNQISKIDFSNIWMYESEKYRRGGIDEYALDNFNEIGYVSLHKFAEEHLDKYGLFPDYNRHPNFVVYLTFFKQFLVIFSIF